MIKSPSCPMWHVVYTRPNTEKKVASSINEMGLESYLPLHKVIRQWSDRKKWLELPLFPNYVFVKVTDVKRASLFSVKHLVKFVSMEKKPVLIQDKVITTIKRVLSEDSDVYSEDYFHEGMNVRIAHGQFAGLEGIILKRNNQTRLVIRIDALMKAYSICIPVAHAECIRPITDDRLRHFPNVSRPLSMVRE